MRKLFALLTLVLLFCPTVFSQNNKVVFITIDGLRWQELFTGADSALTHNSTFVGSVDELSKKFYRATPTERRETLMPFMWSTIKNKGVLIGNRNKDCKMNVANKMHFSYPGYQELLCGFADDENITSNDNIYNPNQNILEIANNTPKYKGKILVYASWLCFPYILNEKRSHLEINASFKHSPSPRPTAREKFLDKLQDEIRPMFGDEHDDSFTFEYALEGIKTRHPDVVYVAFGDVDDYAHSGRYDEYLTVIHRTDSFISQLWNYMQSDKYYRGKTTFVITCDHGRGNCKDDISNWRHHANTIPGSDQTWIAAVGNQIPCKGEVTTPGQYYNNQVAATLASLMGIKFHPTHAGAGTKIVF
jgi:hypothetical protein